MRKKRRRKERKSEFIDSAEGKVGTELNSVMASDHGTHERRKGVFQTAEPDAFHNRESPVRENAGRKQMASKARRKKAESVSGSGTSRQSGGEGKNAHGSQKTSENKTDIFRVVEEPEKMQGFVPDGVEGISGRQDRRDKAPPVSKHTQTYQKRARKSEERLKQAEGRIPTQKTVKPEVFKNVETGKWDVEFRVIETPKPWKKNIVRKGKRTVMASSANYVRSQIEKGMEDDSLAGMVLDKSERTMEGTVFAAKYISRRRVRRLNRKARKLEQRHFKAQGKYLYRKYLDEHPEMKKRLIRKQRQKKKMLREYKKAYRRAKQGEKIREQTGKTAQIMTVMSVKLKEFLSKSRTLLVTLAVAAVFLLIVSTGFSSCMMVFSDTVSTSMFSGWLSAPKEIDMAELAISEKEVALQEEIDRIEEDYPDYDEYRYNLGEIGHDPFEIVNYLSATYVNFSFADVEGEIDRLFEEMYVLTRTEVVEKRTRTEIQEKIDPETGLRTEVEVEVEYDYYILDVKLEAKPLASVIALSLDGEQQELYAAYQESKGGLQQLSTPIELNWYPYVSSYYGYRLNPFSKQKQLHKGLDIAVPEGTAVYAGQSGIVATAGYHDEYGNYIVIEDEDGLISKYAHLSSVDVTAGQDVEMGEKIGETGSTGSSTGSHLHIEVFYGGEYYNPLFYFDVGTGTLYGEALGGSGSVVPPGTYDDATVQALMEEAARYIGMPYTFGGTPPESFDCSGYVCWVYSNSGAYDLPRTTAQGIYDQCRHISAGEARAGDLIFFTGTYNAGRPVTHVGIYCGNGVMAHCGSPIKYSNINTSYWQSHFYGWGRLLE